MRARVEETSARSNCEIAMRDQSAIGVRGRWCEKEDEGEDEEDNVEELEEQITMQLVVLWHLAN